VLLGKRVARRLCHAIALRLILLTVTGFHRGGLGLNPGAVRKYVPEQPEQTLVVVLHGGTQTAASYDLGAG
jgi:poly(3-hydroxybutyrate) depolymerase